MSSSEGISALESFSSSGSPQSDAPTSENFPTTPTLEPLHSKPHQSAYLLASKLRAKFGDRPSVLAMTSVTGGEGVSSAVADLGRVLSATRAGDSVLIIDANFSAPAQHASFGLARSPGLVELLSGEISMNDAIRATRWPKLFVLPAGEMPEEARTAFDPARYAQIVAALRSQFHTIVVDSPALPALNVTPFVMTNTDGVVLMIAPGRHSRSRVKQSVDEISSLGVEFVGICLAVSEAPDRSGTLARFRAWLRTVFYRTT